MASLEEEEMGYRALIAALTCAAALAGGAEMVVAQPVPYDRGYSLGYSNDDFWRGAPDGLQQRIDWVQQRINRGVADGSLDRDDARRAQWELDSLRRDATALQQRLDGLSRSVRWARQDAPRYGDYSGYGEYRAPYSTDYDAARYYRDDPQYVERRLGPADEVYRGSDGRYYCKRSDGTTGLVLGAIGGAALGNVIDGGRDRVAGTLIGGALGAFLGKSVDQNSDVRCR